MNTTCPGKLTLEQYFSRELDNETAAEVKDHFKYCDSCNAYVKALERKKFEFLEEHPYSQWAKNSVRVAEPTFLQQLYAFLMKPSLIPLYGAALVLCLIVPTVLMKLSDPAVSYKGGKDITFVYQREKVVHDGTLSEAYQRGDQIQVSYSYSGKHYAGLLSVDTRGTVSFYHQNQQAPVMTVEQKRGGTLQFPGSIVLDGSAGEELVILIIADKPLGTEQVRAWAQHLYEQAGVLATMEKLCGDKPMDGFVEVRTLLLKKR